MTAPPDPVLKSTSVADLAMLKRNDFPHREFYTLQIVAIVNQCIAGFWGVSVTSPSFCTTVNERVYEG
jgi:hypothetical protein